MDHGFAAGSRERRSPRSDKGSVHELLGERGQTLPLLLVVLALGVMVIAALLYAVDARLLTARHRAERVREQYAADAGVEYALNRLMASPYCPAPGSVSLLSLPAVINEVSPTVSVRCLSGPVEAGAWVAITASAQSLLEVFFLDENNGWAVGGDGTILHTTDGGLTWTTQSESPQFPPSKDIEGVVFKDANCGWSVGEGNKKSIQWTTDGGVVWHLTAKEQTGDLYAVTYDHTSLGWIVGQGGEIWSVDCAGGIAYRGSSAVRSDLFAVDFVDGTTGWVAGVGGTIARTGDGGLTWALQTVTRTDTLYGVYFRSATAGWAVGAGGVVWATADGGTNWRLHPVTTTQTLRSVAFSDANTGWIVGDGGTLLRSTDGGATWQPFSVPGAGSLTSVYFTDPGHGWIAGANGVLYRYIPGGASGVYDVTATAGSARIEARVNASPGKAVVISWQVR